jgi:photosystem II stability/assembly factor-like uncharacterized protein
MPKLIQITIFLVLVISLAGCTGNPSTNAAPSQIPSTPSPTSSAYPIPETASPTPPILVSPSPTNSVLATPSPMGVSAELWTSSLHMFDANNGWAVQTIMSSSYPVGSKILHTSTGLQDWKEVNPPLPQGKFALPVWSFIDQKQAIGIFVQTAENSPVTEMTAWRTTDGGLTWEKGESTQFASTNQINDFRANELDMVSSDQGWLLGRSSDGSTGETVYVFETTTAGKHWEMVYDTTSHTKDSQGLLWFGGSTTYNDNAFSVSTQNRLFFSNSNLWVSQDSGKTWNPQQLPAPKEYPNLDTSLDANHRSSISAPDFNTPKDGFLVRRVFRKEQVISPPLEYQGIPDAEYLYVTNDGGQNWSSRPVPVKLGVVYFLDSQHGWLLGIQNADQIQTTDIYRTTNGGVTWEQIATDSPVLLGSEIQFIDEQTGFAFVPFPPSTYYSALDHRIISAGTPWMTINGGKSWTLLNIQSMP